MEVFWKLFTSFLDIFIVSILVYVLIRVLSRTKQNIYILIGLLGYGALFVFAKVLNLELLSFILSQVYTWGIIIVVILFQNEIRSSIEKIGSLGSLFSSNNANLSNDYIDDFAKTMMHLGSQKIGALVAFELDVSLTQYKKNAINLDANYSRYVLESIFLKNSPLHDGAVIIKDGKIECASAYFPIAVDLNLAQKFGTRHRAGVTLSRESDAIVVIVSEESGDVSIAYGGELYDNIDQEFLTMFIKEKVED